MRRSRAAAQNTVRCAAVRDVRDACEQLQTIGRHLRSLAHPLRLQALLLLELEASPVELQRALGLPDVSLVARHVRVLHGHGLINLTRTEVRRGAIEHFYRQSDHGVRVLKAMRPWTAFPPGGPVPATRNAPRSC